MSPVSITLPGLPSTVSPRRSEAGFGRVGDGQIIEQVQPARPLPPYREGAEPNRNARSFEAEARAFRAEGETAGRQARDPESRQDRSAALFSAASGLTAQDRGLGGFLAQSLAQAEAEPSLSGTDGGDLRLRPDGAERGSLAYRRAGGEPVLFTEEPSFFRIRA